MSALNCSPIPNRMAENLGRNTTGAPQMEGAYARHLTFPVSELLVYGYGVLVVARRSHVQVSALVGGYYVGVYHHLPIHPEKRDDQMVCTRPFRRLYLDGAKGVPVTD